MWNLIFIFSFLAVMTAGEDVSKETYWVVKTLNQTPTELTPLNMDQLLDKNSEKLVFMIHGWRDNRLSGWFEILSNNFLTVHPTWTIVQVDWSVAASPVDYYEASNNTKPIGTNVGNFISDIVKSELSSPDKILIVGHSLGAHVSGFAGKSAQKSGNIVSRIVGLDPAFPPYNELPCDQRICKSDAKYLEAIHTDMGVNGVIIPIGHSDFFPNGGTNQTGCDPENHACNHNRAVAYFMEGVSFPNHFEALKCPDYNSYVNNKDLCDKKKANMVDLDMETEGLYYLQTNGVPPYSKN